MVPLPIAGGHQRANAEMLAAAGAAVVMEDAETGEFVYRTRIDDTRIIAPAIDAGGVLLGYATSGRLVAMRPK